MRGIKVLVVAAEIHAVVVLRVRALDTLSSGNKEKISQPATRKRRTTKTHIAASLHRRGRVNMGRAQNCVRVYRGFL